MKQRLIYGFVGVLGVVLGLDNLVTGVGSLVFSFRAVHNYGMPGTHYTGFAARLEGAIFIIVGLYCLYRAWRLKSNGDDA